VHLIAPLKRGSKLSISLDDEIALELDEDTDLSRANQKRKYQRSGKGKAQQQRAYAKWSNTWSGRAARTLAHKRSECRRKGLDFDLTKDWIVNHIKGSCEMTGLDFRHIKTSDTKGVGKSGPDPYSPSIDRINPRKGYTMDNCRMVLNCVNVFKQQMNDSQVLEIAEALVGKLINLKIKRR
jgi:hypothetical protein